VDFGEEGDVKFAEHLGAVVVVVFEGVKDAHEVFEKAFGGVV